MEGSTQSIQVSTNPPGARCIIKNEEETLATIEQTPDFVDVKKLRSDATITCEKPGYAPMQKTLVSDFSKMTAGNLVWGLISLPGFGVDAATGAINKYDERVELKLSPVP
jgi:hypothetical protein